MAIAITLISFNSYSQAVDMEKLAKEIVANDQSRYKQDEIVLPKPAVGSLITPIIPNTDFMVVHLPNQKRNNHLKACQLSNYLNYMVLQVLDLDQFLNQFLVLSF